MTIIRHRLYEREEPTSPAFSIKLEPWKFHNMSCFCLGNGLDAKKEMHSAQPLALC